MAGHECGEGRSGARWLGICGGVVWGLLWAGSPSVADEACDPTEMRPLLETALHARGVGDQDDALVSSDAEVGFGALPVFTKDEVRVLRCLLRALPAHCARLEKQCTDPWKGSLNGERSQGNKERGAGEMLARLLYGSIHNPVFPDFIAYIPNGGHVPSRAGSSPDVTFLRPTFLWRNESRRYIYGAQHVWILIFTETRPNDLPLEGRLTTVYARPPNPLVHLFGALGKSAAVLSDGEKSDEKTQKLEFNWVSLTGDQNPIFLGQARATVGIDTVNRISIYSGSAQVRSEEGRKTLTVAKDGRLEIEPCPKCQPEQKESDAKGGPLAMDARSLHGVFSNSRADYGGVSIAAGGSWNAGGSSFGSDDVHANAYVLGKFYLGRPLRPTLRVPASGGGLAYRPSLGIFLGTNVNGDAFQELVYGISLGHLVGRTGIALGVTSIEGRKADSSGPAIDRKARPFFAFEYTF
jgi:hypothetical protein